MRRAGEPTSLPAGSGLGARTDHPIRILTTGLAGIVTVVLLCLPFGLSVIELTGQPPFFTSGLLDQIVATAGGYPYLTVNAYNPWALVTGDTGYSLANAGLWVCDDAGTRARLRLRASRSFGPIPAVVVGTALLLAVDRRRRCAGRRAPAGPADAARRAGRPGARVLRGPDPRPRALRATRSSPSAVILAAISWRWRVAYLVLSVTIFLNMYVGR